MSDQIIIVCDDQGNPTGEYVPKEEGITGDGKKHLAITVVLYNQKGQVLLQKRRHLVFDNLWDLTASTDLSHLENGDETFEDAAARCLRREWRIRKIRGMRKIGGFNYFAKDRDWCENEYDVILVGEYDGPINMDPSVGYEYKWMDKQEFLKDIELNPKRYTPWANEGIKLLKSVDFFLYK